MSSHRLQQKSILYFTSCKQTFDEFLCGIEMCDANESENESGLYENGQNKNSSDAGANECKLGESYFRKYSTASKAAIV